MGVGWWLEWDGREQKVGFAEKNCAYGSLDSIVSIKGGMFLPVVTCHNLPPQKKSRQGDGIPGLVLAYFGRMD